MNKRLVSMIFIGLFLIVGCASSGPELASSAADITGIFTSANGHAHARFDEDGTFRLAPSLMPVTLEPPIASPGEYWFEGEQLHLKPGEDDPVCGGVSAVYEVRLSESGHLGFVAHNDACGVRAANMQGALELETDEPIARWLPVE